MSIVWNFLCIQSCHLQTKRLYFLLPNVYLSFSYIIILGRISSSTMMNRNGKRGHHFLVSHLRCKASSFSLLNIVLASRVVVQIFLRKFPSISGIMRVLIMNEC